MKITEHYVSFEVAKLLKEKGFDEGIDLWYDENGDKFFKNGYDISFDWRVKQGQKVYKCPSIEDVCAWLREIYGLHIYVVPIWEDVEYQYGQWEEELTGYRYHIVSVGKYNNTYKYPNTKALTVESSYNAGIKYILENLI